MTHLFEVCSDTLREPVNIFPEIRRDTMMSKPTKHTIQTAAKHARTKAKKPKLARAGVTPQVAQRIMRHGDYRTTLKHYTVLGLTDTVAAMDHLPGIARERHSDAMTGTTDTAPTTWTNRPQLICQQLERGKGHNRAASRDKLTRGNDRGANEKPRRSSGFPSDSPEFSAKRAKGLEPSTFSLGS